MFIPYRVIQIKSKAHPDPFDSTRSSPSSYPLSLIDCIDPQYLTISHRNPTPNPKVQQTQGKRPGERAKSSVGTSVKTQVRSSAKPLIQLSQNNKARLVKEPQPDPVQNKKRIKVRINNNIEDFCCFNFSTSLDQKKNYPSFHRYAPAVQPAMHRSLNLNTVANERPNTQSYTHRPRNPTKNRDIGTAPGRSRKSDPTKKDISLFQTYVSEVQQAKRYYKNRYKVGEVEPIDIRAKEITMNEAESISHDKQRIIQSLYNQWKNSYRLHIQGKTIRRWNKRNASKESIHEEEKVKGGPQSKVLREKTKKEEKIEAWVKNETVEREDESYFDCGPSFT